MDIKTSKFYHIGLCLGSNSSHLSSVCVIDRNKNIVLLDKLYFNDDIRLFFETSPYVQNSIIMIGLIPDESLLEGKWRIHSKNYKPIEGLFEINRNNWTKRLNDRLCSFFASINNTRAEVYRCNLNLLRQSYGLSAEYVEKTSLDCKDFQTGLKLKYNFRTLPDNLLPAASLEAILYSLFAHNIAQSKVGFKQISEFYGLKVLTPQNRCSLSFCK